MRATNSGSSTTSSRNACQACRAGTTCKRADGELVEDIDATLRASLDGHPESRIEHLMASVVITFAFLNLLLPALPSLKITSGGTRNASVRGLRGAAGVRRRLTSP